MLSLQEGRLQQQGVVDHIAPSEDIRSVRFDGERGFMVTFKSITERGRVANPPTPNGQYDHSLCSNWWSNASSEVKRSLFMDDFVYAVSANGIHVQDTRSLGKDVATVTF